jgi:hypothetical protein
MSRTIVAPEQMAENLSAGIKLKRIQRGGRRGPNDEVLGNLIGGQVWSEMFMFGEESDGPPMCVPDIRLPANQYWPLHFHDCWIAVVILDGSCLIGDWHMQVGDVMISEEHLEYGPLVIGPDGCQMFEIFARLIPDEGGYAPEFWDHPTLQGSARKFVPRSERNLRNAGRQVLPVDGVEGLTKGHLHHGAQWDLGRADDPERAILRSTHLSPGEVVAPHSYDDWHGVFVLDGSMTLDRRNITKNDVLIIEPNGRLDELAAGPGGAKLMEVSRKANGSERHFDG